MFLPFEKQEFINEIRKYKIDKLIIRIYNSDGWCTWEYGGYPIEIRS